MGPSLCDNEGTARGDRGPGKSSLLTCDHCMLGLLFLDSLPLCSLFLLSVLILFLILTPMNYGMSKYEIYGDFLLFLHIKTHVLEFICSSCSKLTKKAVF